MRRFEQKVEVSAPSQTSSKWHARLRWLTVASFVVLVVASIPVVVHKARRGKTAFVRWMADTQAVWSGDQPVYFRDASAPENEGFPGPPATLALLTPFHALGPIAGSLAWLVFKGLLTAATFWFVVEATRGRGPPWPPWAVLALLLLAAHAFQADLAHGNLNILIAFLVAAGLYGLTRARDLAGGLAIGVAAVLKLTPALLVVYLAWKRRWSAVGGSALGAALVAVVVPALVFGPTATVRLTQGWATQMIAPFARGESPRHDRVGHANQSLYAQVHRLLGDYQAIEEEPEYGLPKVQVNLLELPPSTIRWVFNGLAVSLVGLTLLSASTPREDRRHLGHAAEVGAICLVMLLCSPRTWKHHYVLAVFAQAFLLRALLVLPWPREDPRRRLVLGALVASTCAFYLSSPELLGRRLSDWAEALGAFVFAAVALLVGSLVALRKALADDLNVENIEEPQGATG